ncbi:hypothetical protein AEA42_13250, partial [Shewanella sp. Sh95]
EQGRAQVADGAVRLDAHDDEGDERDHRHHQREADERRARDVEAGHDARDVRREHREEDGRQQRDEPARGVLADDVLGDVDPHEVEGHLRHVLATVRHEAGTAGGGPAQRDQEPRREAPAQDGPVEPEHRPLGQHRGREEPGDRRRMEPGGLRRGERGDRREAGQSGT